MNDIKVIIDRFEGDFAVVEVEIGVFVTIDKSLLPGAKEGDVISITIDNDETTRTKERITKLMENLWEE